MKWIVYILECADTSLYTGITNDLERRLEEHRTGRGAKYTKHRSPLRVRYTEYRSTKKRGTRTRGRNQIPSPVRKTGAHRPFFTQRDCLAG